MTFDAAARRSKAMNDLHKQFGDDDHAQLEADYRELLELPAFRRVLVSILKKARVFGSLSFDTTDANAVMKAVGFRELGVDIYMAANRADGDMVLLAIEERNDIERERRARILALNEHNETEGL